MFRRTVRLTLVTALAFVVATPAAAQLGFSDSYNFLKAVRDSKGQDIETLLSKPGTTIINTHDPSSGEGALHIVVKRGDTTYLRYLLQHGADPNIRDKAGTTPLMLAVSDSEEPCVAILIKANADVNLANDSGETPLIRAVQLRNIQLVRELLDAHADPDQVDHIAGKSARDYADQETRSPAIRKLLDDAPKTTHQDVVGPQL